ncbi:class I SAM-dependent methyltransferase [Sedimentibacter hydroxybenzoicus DSM 7310]|uniref:Class I SAM-dependent methyltransferase n=1 Tax=Sedimentibacter hydroxybenzoicus DSM 7310 TaxID=1123245 RepID=A0A974GWD1_SEDHY|nr:class I SAM-dependent methyltransferase [Sedimentibacter hydroxybenzoicus]NYB74318.1 class I SAM-dependent methyltransferase [Sedimentibacter hydroxybenzoicus DSM 7310]
MKRYSVDESLEAWEANAKFWDDCMGDQSNQFHREVVRPKVSELLNIKEDDFILDVACGNGNYSAYIAEQGADIVAFDYSEKMIALAQKRQSKYSKKIEFCIIDATDEQALLSLRRTRPYTKAVSNMAIMDIADITKLFRCVNELLSEDGIFVFATQHPCFMTLTEKYSTAHSYYGIAINGQPKEQCYYHRSLQEIFDLCFQSGFVIDGFYEESYGIKEKPDVIIVRIRKI